MAEDTQTQDGTQTADTKPAFDPDAIKSMVEGAVRTSLEAIAAKAQQEQADAAAVAAQNKPADANKGQDLIGEMIKPHLESTLKAAKDAETRALHAADAAQFYTDPGNAEAVGYRAKIEQVVGDQLKRGNSISRNDAWKWLRGGELYEDIQKRRDDSRKLKEEEAKFATAAGAGAQRGGQQTKPIGTMSTDELGETLRGISF
jgi:hypothetical protein